MWEQERPAMQRSEAESVSVSEGLYVWERKSEEEMQHSEKTQR